MNRHLAFRTPPSGADRRVRFSLMRPQPALEPVLTIAVVVSLSALCVAGFTPAPGALVILPAVGAGMALVCAVSVVHRTLRHRRARRQLAGSSRAACTR